MMYSITGLYVNFIFALKNIITIDKYVTFHIIVCSFLFPLVILYVITTKPILFLIKKHKERYNDLSPTQLRKIKFRKIKIKNIFNF